ncbi:MAG: fused MFS/spermidine synthase [Treponema sp.]|nr:fused MFS/spermidine synthase [Treponema sp.]
MILELVGSRMLAPFLGASIVVWTALIGVIMASLAAGYYAGGCIADARPW